MVPHVSRARSEKTLLLHLMHEVVCNMYRVSRPPAAHGEQLFEAEAASLEAAAALWPVGRPVPCNPLVDHPPAAGALALLLLQKPAGAHPHPTTTLHTLTPSTTPAKRPVFEGKSMMAVLGQV